MKLIFIIIVLIASGFSYFFFFQKEEKIKVIKTGYVETEAGNRFIKMTGSEKYKDKLSPQAYEVMFEQGTERAFTSPLNEEKRTGHYNCAACGEHLFESGTKFDSGTGWPSFDDAIEGSVNTSVDFKLGYERVEFHCATCGAHLGHVFDDGPKHSTGKRFCTNGVALEFKEAE